jgi:hypothetical protein
MGIMWSLVTRRERAVGCSGQDYELRSSGAGIASKITEIKFQSSQLRPKRTKSEDLCDAGCCTGFACVPHLAKAIVPKLWSCLSVLNT